MSQTHQHSVDQPPEPGKNQKRNDLKMTLEDSQVIEFMNNSHQFSALVQSSKHFEKTSGEALNFIHILDNQSPYQAKLHLSHLESVKDHQDQVSTDSERRETSQANHYPESNHVSSKMFTQTPIHGSKTSIRNLETSQTAPNYKQAAVASHGSRNTLQFINEPFNSDTRIVGSSIDKVIKEMPTRFSVYSSQQKLSKFQNSKFETFAWGLNDQNQLGLQNHVSPRMFGSCKKSVLIPRQLKDLSFDPEFVACGLEHTVILTQSGEIWGLGSNQEFSLGLTPKQIETFSNGIIKIELPFQDQNISSVYCGYHHSILKLKNGQIYGCGLNDKGQLGISTDFSHVQGYTMVPLETRSIHKVSCGPYSSSFLDLDSQQLYFCGQLGEFSSGGIIQFDLSQEIPGESVQDVRLGRSCMLALTEQGNVYLKVQDSPFGMVNNVANVKEVAVCDTNYVVLTQCNNIYEWMEDKSDTFRKIENSFDKVAQFSYLSVGAEFGHVVDQDRNLYGWGNNKNGELGTGDSYPRPKLSQVRIFNNEKQYMRCFQVFAGPNHAIAVFESNQSPNGIGTDQNRSRAGSLHSGQYRSTNPDRSSPLNTNINFNRTTDLSNSQKKPSLPLPPSEQLHHRKKESQSLDYSPGAQRRIQYQKTEEALKKYRAQAQSYRENVQRIREHLSHDDKQPSNRFDSMQNSLKPPKAKSISPMRGYEQKTTGENKGTQNYNSVNTFSFQPSINNGMGTHEHQAPNDAYEDQQPEKESPQDLKLYLLKSKFAQQQNMRSSNFQQSNEAPKPMTFAHQQNHIDSESSRTAGTVRLNKKIENQMKYSQGVIQKSRSHRSNVEKRNAAVLSPPCLQDRANHKLQEYIQMNSYNKHESLNFPDPSAFNLTNQRKQHNLVDVKTPSSKYQFQNFTQTNADEDTYELSQSICPAGIQSSDVNTPHPYRLDLPMVPSINQSRKSSYQHYMQPTSIHFLQTGNTLSESDAQQHQIQYLPKENHQVPSQQFYGSNYANQRAINYQREPVHQHNQSDIYPQANNYIRHHEDYSASPIQQKAQRQHPRHNSSQHETTTNTFANDRSHIEQHKDDPVVMSKLNKYRRKLKKYIAKNQEHQKEVQFYKRQVDDFQEQNARIIRCTQQEEERMQQVLKAEQNHFSEFQQIVQQERMEKQRIIQNLTDENVQLVNELRERDHKHMILEQKMCEVQLHVSEVTNQLNSYLQENREIKHENQQLFEQLLDKDNLIRDLEYEIESYKINQESYNKIKDEGKDQTIEMLRNQIEELLEANKAKDKEVRDKVAKINHLKNRRKEEKRVSKDLEITVKDLKTQLQLSQQQMKMIYFNNRRNDGKMPTIDEMPMMQSDSPMRRHSRNTKSHTKSNTQNTYSQEKSDSRPTSGLHTGYNDASQFQNQQINCLDQSQFKPKHLMSHTSSSRFTTQTHLTSYTYGPDIAIKNRLHFQQRQVTPTQKQDLADTRNLTEINEDSTLKMVEMDQRFRGNIQHQRSNIHMVKDGHQYVRPNSREIPKQRAKSGPSESHCDDKSYQEQIISLRNEKEMITNPFAGPNMDQSYLGGMINPAQQIVSMSSINNANFPNLNYVQKKYFNPENQSYADNGSAVRNFNHASDNQTCSPGQFSQFLDSYARNTNRQSELPTHILGTNPYSQKDLRNKSTQVQSGHNLVSNGSLTENGVISNTVGSNQFPTKVQSPRVTRTKKEDQSRFENLTFSQQKEAFELYLKAKKLISPRLTSTAEKHAGQPQLTQSAIVPQIQPSFAPQPQSGVKNGSSKSVVNTSVQKMAAGTESSNLNGSTMMSKDERANTSGASYKDMILSKMNQKVSVIQNILNKKREQEMATKELVVKTAPTERVADKRPFDHQSDKPSMFRNLSNRPVSTTKPEATKISSFDNILSESTLNKLNLSAINQESNERCRSKEIEKQVTRKLYTSTNEDATQKLNERRQNDLSKIQDFQESSKSWEQRRGRSNNSSEYNSHDVVNKYKEAYRGLSQEIKRKMQQHQKEATEEEYVGQEYN